MRKMAFVWASAATFAVIGFCLGYVIHGVVADALVPALAGGAGGFGIGCGSVDVLRRWSIAGRDA